MEKRSMGVGRMARWMLVWVAMASVTMVGMPWLLVDRFEAPIPKSQPTDPSQRTDRKSAQSMSQPPPVRTASHRSMSVERYVHGVVAAEMPAKFASEALQAQAIVARTYALYQHYKRTGGGIPLSAVVPEQIATWQQAYADEATLKKKWGARYETYASVIAEAVAATSGMVLTYAGQPIEAVFFSTANGYTEDAGAVWSQTVPYLRSVPSPWDAPLSPYAERTQKIPKETICQSLRLQCPTDRPLQWQEVRRSPTGRLLSVRIEGERITGRQLRQALQLPSTDVQWRESRGTVYVTTKGYGHGVGMSQWGAQGMALAGKDVQDILQHYYPGTEIVRDTTAFAPIRTGSGQGDRES